MKTFELITLQNTTAIIGTKNSDATKQISFIASSLNVPQMRYIIIILIVLILNIACSSITIYYSGTALASELSNKQLYKTFIRTVPSSADEGRSLARVVYDLGWRHVAVIAANDLTSDGSAVSFEAGCSSTPEMVQVVLSRRFPRLV
jgi:hypothetical protein